MNPLRRTLIDASALINGPRRMPARYGRSRMQAIDRAREAGECQPMEERFNEMSIFVCSSSCFSPQLSSAQLGIAFSHF